VKPVDNIKVEEQSWPDMSSPMVENRYYLKKMAVSSTLQGDKKFISVVASGLPSFVRKNEKGEFELVPTKVDFVNKGDHYHPGSAALREVMENKALSQIAMDMKLELESTNTKLKIKDDAFIILSIAAGKRFANKVVTNRPLLDDRDHLFRNKEQMPDNYSVCDCVSTEDNPLCAHHLAKIPQTVVLVPGNGTCGYRACALINKLSNIKMLIGEREITYNDSAWVKVYCIRYYQHEDVATILSKDSNFSKLDANNIDCFSQMHLDSKYWFDVGTENWWLDGWNLEQMKKGAEPLIFQSITDGIYIERSPQPSLMNKYGCLKVSNVYAVPKPSHFDCVQYDFSKVAMINTDVSYFDGVYQAMAYIAKLGVMILDIAHQYGGNKDEDILSYECVYRITDKEVINKVEGNATYRNPHTIYQPDDISYVRIGKSMIAKMPLVALKFGPKHAYVLSKVGFSRLKELTNYNEDTLNGFFNGLGYRDVKEGKVILSDRVIKFEPLDGVSYVKEGVMKADLDVVKALLPGYMKPHSIQSIANVLSRKKAGLEDYDAHIIANIIASTIMVSVVTTMKNNADVQTFQNMITSGIVQDFSGLSGYIESMRLTNYYRYKADNHVRLTKGPFDLVKRMYEVLSNELYYINYGGVFRASMLAGSLPWRFKILSVTFLMLSNAVRMIGGYHNFLKRGDTFYTNLIRLLSLLALFMKMTYQNKLNAIGMIWNILELFERIRDTMISRPNVVVKTAGFLAYDHLKIPSENTYKSMIPEKLIVGVKDPISNLNVCKVRENNVEVSQFEKLYPDSKPLVYSDFVNLFYEAEKPFSLTDLTVVQVGPRLCNTFPRGFASTDANKYCCSTKYFNYVPYYNKQEQLEYEEWFSSEFTDDLVSKIDSFFDKTDVTFLDWLSNQKPLVKAEMKEMIANKTVSDEEKKVYKLGVKTDELLVVSQEAGKDSKVRAVFAPSTKFKMMCRGLWAVLKLLSKCEYAIVSGLNWIELAKRFEAIENCFDNRKAVPGDQKSFECTQYSRNLKLVANLLKKICNILDPDWDFYETVIDFMFEEYNDIIVDYKFAVEPIKFTISGTTVSGFPGTTIVNGLLNLSYHRRLFKLCGIREVTINPLTNEVVEYGDVAIVVAGDDSKTNANEAIQHILVDNYRRIFCLPDDQNKGLGQILKGSYAFVNNPSFISTQRIVRNDGSVRIMRDVMRFVSNCAFSKSIKLGCNYNKNLNKIKEQAWAMGMCMKAWSKGLPLFDNYANCLIRLGKRMNGKVFQDFKNQRQYGEELRVSEDVRLDDYELTLAMWEIVYDLPRDLIKKIELQLDGLDQLNVMILTDLNYYFPEEHYYESFEQLNIREIINNAGRTQATFSC